MVKVAVDAMGGDYAPKVVVEGVIEALRRFDVFVYLVGPADLVEAELAKHRKFDRSRVEVVAADEIIEMHEPPAAAIRKKKNSSINIGIGLCKEGKADAFFSAGNTGAAVCGATLKLGLLESIERPGIAIVMPNLLGVSLIIDAGANIDPKPLHLLQYGLMGSAYFEQILGKKNPRVGLLNVGEEETKGTEFMKETYQLLEQSPINFIGNVEGKEIFSGNCDVIVCDGFVGNVTLKVAESISETIAYFLRKELLSSIWGKLGYLLARPCFKRFKKQVDYSEYGGAPLLGVDGVVIIGHGRSTSKAVMNAIRFAKEEVERHINESITEQAKKLLAKV
ncbi:MAG: phosphate acyltransferase PlsX [Candidatus Omnitrophica bacterium]|nr:phosphate acyltransferase PlsX [Candidatus Omnitrophota bacterium]MDD5574402.1 phosphate acyltransferase PlsX [Candidatus Omnitrophota bacterium]